MNNMKILENTGFIDIVNQYRDFDFNEFYNSVTENNVLQVIGRRKLSYPDYLTLLSPAAESCLEEMAQAAHEITIRQFGRTILLYTPLYLSNFCENRCVYCSFNNDNTIKRKQLSFKEIEQEAKVIAETGLKHILILTGSARNKATVQYLEESIIILKKYFSSISIEIYPMEESEYVRLIDAGVDNLTIYQETYNQVLYKQLHPSGPKRDYEFRLNTPERACRAGIRSVNIGALLGLDDFRSECFISGIHAEYLQSKYPSIEIAMSFPRMRPFQGNNISVKTVSDKNLIQVILALRLFLHRAGISISTRESAELRDNLIPLGTTKMSAGSKTSVGGYQKEDEETQFEIDDRRTVEEVKNAIYKKGYQPVFKDWQYLC